MFLPRCHPHNGCVILAITIYGRGSKLSSDRTYSLQTKAFTTLLSFPNLISFPTFTEVFQWTQRADPIAFQRSVTRGTLLPVKGTKTEVDAGKCLVQAQLSTPDSSALVLTAWEWKKYFISDSDRLSSFVNITPVKNAESGTSLGPAIFVCLIDYKKLLFMHEKDAVFQKL